MTDANPTTLETIDDKLGKVRRLVRTLFIVHETHDHHPANGLTDAWEAIGQTLNVIDDLLGDMQDALRR